VPICQSCQVDDIPPGHRFYCVRCSPRASALWKSKTRRESVRQWRAGETTEKPWLDGWPDVESRRAYFREYMRSWRLKNRARSIGR